MARRAIRSNPVSLFAFQDIITSTTGILILLALILILSITTKTQSSASPVIRADKQQLATLDRLKMEVEVLRNPTENPLAPNVSLMSKSPREIKEKLEQLIASNTALKAESEEKTLVERKLVLLNKENSQDPLAEELEKATGSIAALEETIRQIKTSNRIVYNFRETLRTPWLVQIDDGQLLAAMVGSDKVKSFKTSAEFIRFAEKLPKKQRYVVMIVRPHGIANFDVVKSALGKAGFDLGTELIGDTTTAIDPIKGAVF